jgi:hypothetical protein
MVRSISCLAAMAVLFTPALRGQESTTEFLKRWRAKGPARAPIVLLMREEDLKAPAGKIDLALMRLKAGRDLMTLGLDKDAAADIWKDRALPKGPHWFLFAREGDVLLEGGGIPRGEQLLDSIHAAWGSTRSERLEGFLREHPDNGEALDCQLAASLRLAFSLSSAFGWSKEALREVDADVAFADCADSLGRFLELPDWWRSSELDLLDVNLFLSHGGKSARLRPLLERMKASLAEELGRNPHLQRGSPTRAQLYNAELPRLWLSLAQSLGSGTRIEWPHVAASPGRAWPDFSLLLQEACTQDSPAAKIASLQGLTVPDPPPSPGGWSSYCGDRAEIQRCLLSSYASLGLWPEALAALADLRRWEGSKFKGKEELKFLAEFDLLLKPETSEGDRPPSAEAKLPKGLIDLANSPPEPDPVAPPPPPPVRMVLWGTPTWTPAWAGLLGNPAFLPWLPEELRWGSATPEDGRLLAAAGLQPPQWALRQGETGILAHGNGVPKVQEVLSGLAQAGPSRLQVLDTFIRQNPQQMDARRDRFDLLRPRLPHPALEAILAEDAFTAWIPLDFAPEQTSVPALWKARAAHLLPEVEDALRRWPVDASLWKAWLTWSAFSPRPASPRAFALGLDHWQPLGEWLAGLPSELHEAVAAECRKAGRFDLMLDWFQPAADALASGVFGGREIMFKGLPRKAVAAGLAEAKKGLASARR